MPASADTDKLRGGYYTSADIADWLTGWAVRTRTARVLEPSCGDGVFLESIVRKLAGLGGSPASIEAQVTAVELDPGEASKSRARLRPRLGEHADRIIQTGDFFGWLEGHPESRFDCVLGNPPFIRYQNFPEPSRSKAMAILQRLGLRPNKLTNTWVPFVGGSVAALAPGGCLAMVLPAELLQVSYAAQLRTFLAGWFENIDILACNEMLFPEAQQETLLFLGSGRLEHVSSQNQCRIDLSEIANIDELTASPPTERRPRGRRKTLNHSEEKWVKYFLPAREISFLRDLRTQLIIGTLGDHAKVDIGVVTGRNDFFVLSRAKLDRYAIHEYAIPLVGRASQLPGAIIDAEEWNRLSEGGQEVHLFHVDSKGNGNLSRGASEYIAWGQQAEVHTGYKCSIRDPWYSVPSVWVPDAFLFRQIYDFPRVVLNRAKAVSTDTIHRMRCRTNVTLLIRNCYTHLSAASAEVEGRSYGGGVLELEPTEAERVLVPACLAKESLPLEQVDLLVREGRLDAVLEENDKAVLQKHLGLGARECKMLRRIWIQMRDRRITRRKRRKPSGQSCGGRPLYLSK